MLVDEAEISIKAGNGGDGAVSFRREKYINRGGPDGGDGGDGGDIIIKCSEDVNTLSQYSRTKYYCAQSGSAGAKKKKTGHGGDDLILNVPPGTIIYDGKSGKVITDFTKRNEIFTIIKGGKGGLGNVHFKSATHQTPREFKPGEKGKQMLIKLELKLIADVGLVGLPNAGKSTLLSAISNANPKVAPYPFTTTEPVLGKVLYKQKDFIVADIPGLIKDASKGRGLGYKFLKHIGRTKIIVHLIDASSPNIEGDYQTVRTELKNFKNNLENKKEIIVLNKIDNTTNFPSDFKYDVAISAITRKNINELLNLIIYNL